MADENILKQLQLIQAQRQQSSPWLQSSQSLLGNPVGGMYKDPRGGMSNAIDPIAGALANVALGGVGSAMAGYGRGQVQQQNQGEMQALASALMGGGGMDRLPPEIQALTAMRNQRVAQQQLKAQGDRRAARENALVNKGLMMSPETGEIVQIPALAEMERQKALNERRKEVARENRKFERQKRILDYKERLKDEAAGPEFDDGSDQWVANTYGVGVSNLKEGNFVAKDEYKRNLKKLDELSEAVSFAEESVPSLARQAKGFSNVFSSQIFKSGGAAQVESYLRSAFGDDEYANALQSVSAGNILPLVDLIGKAKLTPVSDADRKTMAERFGNIRDGRVAAAAITSYLVRQNVHANYVYQAANGLLKPGGLGRAGFMTQSSFDARSAGKARGEADNFMNKVFTEKWNEYNLLRQDRGQQPIKMPRSFPAMAKGTVLPSVEQSEGVLFVLGEAANQMYDGTFDVSRHRRKDLKIPEGVMMGYEAPTPLMGQSAQTGRAPVQETDAMTAAELFEAEGL